MFRCPRGRSGRAPLTHGCRRENTLRWCTYNGRCKRDRLLAIFCCTEFSAELCCEGLRKFTRHQKYLVALTHSNKQSLSSTALLPVFSAKWSTLTEEQRCMVPERKACSNSNPSRYFCRCSRCSFTTQYLGLTLKTYGNIPRVNCHDIIQNWHSATHTCVQLEKFLKTSIFLH